MGDFAVGIRHPGKVPAVDKMVLIDHGAHVAEILQNGVAEWVGYAGVRDAISSGSIKAEDRVLLPHWTESMLIIS